MKKLLLIPLFLFFAGLSAADAQFEGEIKFQIQYYDDGIPVQSELLFTSAGERIMITSENDVNVITGLQSNGVLIRNDQQDFIFNTGKNEALKVSKEDMDGLMDLIQRFGSENTETENADFDWENKVEETGNTQTVHGYEVHEIRLKGESPDQFVSVWLTSDIQMDWGLMYDVWHSVGKNFSETDIPIELLMNPNSFPLVIEVYDIGEIVYKIEPGEINTDDFDRTVLELSDQKVLIGLTDVMMNMFRQR